LLLDWIYPETGRSVVLAVRLDISRDWYQYFLLLDWIYPETGISVVQWFSPGTPVSSTNKTDCHDIAEILRGA
jgi:hypothetical protein